jgi:hypothetical protein
MGFNTKAGKSWMIWGYHRTWESMVVAAWRNNSQPTRRCGTPREARDWNLKKNCELSTGDGEFEAILVCKTSFKLISAGITLFWFTILVRKTSICFIPTICFPTIKTISGSNPADPGSWIHASVAHG